MRVGVHATSYDVPLCCSRAVCVKPLPSQLITDGSCDAVPNIPRASDFLGEDGFIRELVLKDKSSSYPLIG